MKMKWSFTSLLLALGVILPQITAGESPVPLQGLLKDSPFGGDSANLAAKTKPAEIEFRAASQEGTHWFFSIFEPSEKRSSWLELNQPKADILIKAFDPENMIISVEYRGITETLSLKGEKPFLVSAIIKPVPKVRSPFTDKTYHDRPFRIGHVAEEQEIRVAVRSGE